ncbi:MAG TPA: DUF1223 domain-containing protein [Thermoanaerobaculia bacterium]|nr:DUF1223 domain-containing protein [Thermoanaerobaculia bacterium]
MLWIAAAVVVELFTSQGCSSCPPADALISQIEQTRRDVIPLAFHVDYWDNAFWRDPFSSHQWTIRQMMYVHAFALNSAYTPQMVVAGSKQFVGSNATAMNAAIRDAKTFGSVSLQAKRNGNRIDATINADAPPDTDIVLAVFENGLSTQIKGGENMGRRSADDAIVRKIMRVQNGAVSIPVEPSWKNLGVAVFLQNEKTLAIGAADSVTLK